MGPFSTSVRSLGLCRVLGRKTMCKLCCLYILFPHGNSISLAKWQGQVVFSKWAFPSWRQDKQTNKQKRPYKNICQHLKCYANGSAQILKSYCAFQHWFCKILNSKFTKEHWCTQGRVGTTWLCAKNFLILKTWEKIYCLISLFKICYHR